jgi:hypothetical protein
MFMSQVLILHIDIEYRIPVSVLFFTGCVASFLHGRAKAAEQAEAAKRQAERLAKSKPPADSLKIKLPEPRRVYVWNVRLVHDGLELFEVLVMRNEEMWSVWRSKAEMCELRRVLCEIFPNVPIPLIPIPPKEENLPIPPPTIVPDGDTQEHVVIRQRTVYNAWLQQLNALVPVAESLEFLCFIGDNSGLGGPPLVPLSASMMTRYAEEPTVELLNGSSSIIKSPTLSPKASPSAKKSTMSRFKSAAKAYMFGKPATAKPSTVSQECAVDVIPDAIVSAIVDNSAPVVVSYEKWLSEQQQTLGFTGSDFESFEYTDISEEARALFSDNGT